MDWQQKTKSFQGIAAYSWTFEYMIHNDGSESIEGMVVTPDYFQVTGLQPMLGRTFTEQKPGTVPAAVVLLGYEFWQRRFGGDPGIVGQTARISRWRTSPTVIGIMPPGVRFLPSPQTAKEPNYNVNAFVDFWIPVTIDPATVKWPRWNVVARLHEGASMQAAQAELSVLVAGEAQAERDFQGVTVQLQSLRDQMNRDGRRILLPLLGAAALVLLIGCGNAAALMLVRGLQRQCEYAVRSALGMPRAALFGQVASETLLLAVSGGVLGIALAFGVVRLFKLFAAHAIPRLNGVKPGWAVLAWALGAAVLAATLAGLLPALRASWVDPMEVLKSGGTKSSAGLGERRLLRGVTLAQTAFTLALLVGAGLLIRTMMNIASVPAGYDMGRILTISVTAVQGDWNNFHRRALERISALPGVQYAAFAWGVPLTGNNWPVPLEIEGQPAAARETDKIQLPVRAVTPDYFKLMGLPIVDGREFRSNDEDKAPLVAIVNQAFTDRYFPNANPIGKKLWMEGRQKPPMTIIGEIANSRTDDLTQEATPEIYMSLWQETAFSKHLVIRTKADPRSVAVAVQRELHAVDPTAAVEQVKTLEEIRSDSLASRTFAMQLLIGFSVVGSVLTLVGVYGVLSLSVASRRRELAIRTAIGAAQNDIRKLIFTEGFRLIGAGVLAGIALALLLSRVLQSFLFGVQPNDLATLLIVALLFVGVALLACWVPVRRATQVDPFEALRYE
jgi:putative ABC transport system permease protein